MVMTYVIYIVAGETIIIYIYRVTTHVIYSDYSI